MSIFKRGTVTLKAGHGMKLAILVGHSKQDKGASSVAPLRMQEYDYNNEIAQIMFREAMAEGMEVAIFHRDGIGVDGVGKAVDNWILPTDIGCSIELHFNAANGTARGTCILYDKDPPGGKDFAEITIEELYKIFKREGKQKRGVIELEYGDRGHRNLRVVHRPAILVEPAFGDNPEDAALLANLKLPYAAALVRSAMLFMKLQKNGG
jgi:N-acetylmuramoyl-L-alanine amidase